MSENQIYAKVPCLWW